MDPDRIIKYVHKNYTTYWQRVCKLDREKFQTLLVNPKEATAGNHLQNAFGMQLPSSIFTQRSDAEFKDALIHCTSDIRLTDTDFNRLTSGVTPKRLIEIIRHPETQKNIEIALACPGLFECTDVKQIERLLNSHLHSPRRSEHNSNQVIIPEATHDAGLGLSHREERVIKALLSMIVSQKCGVVCWEDAPTIGAALLAYVLAGTYLPKEGIDNIYILRPYPPYREDARSDELTNQILPPFHNALTDLRVELNLLPHASASRILDELHSRQAVLIILNASLIPESGGHEISTIRDLVKLAADRFIPKSGPATIVLIGQPSIRMHPSKVAVAANLQEDLAFGISTTKERSEFFELQWKRFCNLRGHLPSDEQGTRLKRAREYYSKNGDSGVLPATIRMLALFASNYSTFSYFDPTAGLNRLINLPREKWPVDVFLHLDEVFAQICNVPGGPTGTAMRAIHWCSTALYWLTEDAAMSLCRDAPPRTKPESFEAAVERVPHLIDISRDDQGRRIYKMDLGLRALVQDIWAKQEPHRRAWAHYVIANRLFSLQNEKHTLGVEFPIAPHWGRSRMHFLAESIRHYIRACDTFERSAELVNDIHTQEPFCEIEPDPPVPASACDPRQVVNYCFAIIFWQELNANPQTGSVHNRKLSHQHGSYQLTGELLELFSENGKIGTPHWGLNSFYHSRYFREVAYAQLDLGNLSAALEGIDALIKLSGKGGAVTEDNVGDHLDRIVILTAMDSLDAASMSLAEVGKFLNGLSPAVSVEERRIKSKLDFRYQARQAQLHYMRGEFESARSIYNKLSNRSPSSIRRDIAHGYIATLGAIGGEANIQCAMKLCVLNVFENTSRGHHHSALGFRVALGHLFRKCGMNVVAEATLDQVQADILQFGCSERTHLAFLLEAGRIVSLKEMGFARAYAAYLRPCFDRAHSCGYARTARIARTEAERCLRQLLDLFDSTAAPETLNVAALLDGSSHVTSVVTRSDIDPRYALGTDLAEYWFPRLQNRTAIQRELTELSTIVV